jgi:cholesterol oxidase
MPETGRNYDFDFVVIGSGFGGSVAAHRLTEKGYRVAVMEMGRRWTEQNLPKTNWRIWRFIWRPRIALRGFFNLTPFRHVMVAHGCAVGGGSITYANTHLIPSDAIWENGSWAGLADWKAEMPRHYSTARRMLGVVENTILGPADHLLRRAAEAIGVGHTFYRTSVAGYQGDRQGVTHPDPYFGGEGPPRTTCIACGGCMVGCRYNAKNTLDKNYLYLAERHGAQVFPETRVVDVKPLDGVDGAGGYEVRTVSSIAWLRLHRRRFTCRGVVFAASALGTMDLLFRLKEKGSLPAISAALGSRVRTNAESLIGVRVPGGGEDLSAGVAIGSGVYIDEHTHIEATRYSAGSDLLALLSTVLTDGRPGEGRILLWLRTLVREVARHPIRAIRCLQPFGFARETIIFLCMQALEGHIEMRLRRPWYWPFQRVLTSHGQRIPAFIPAANAFASTLASLAGGTPMSTVTEILFDMPMTAHIMGGCPMGAEAASAVVDQRNRVFGYRNMYICDGSVVATNLGVNPGLTICALTERAMTFIPPEPEHRWDDTPVEAR